MGEWISVIDRTPDTRKPVLCLGNKGGYWIGSFCKFPSGFSSDGYWVNQSRKGRSPKYWMPLPEPPEVTSDD